jgi:sugar/nucleoside kinase (ribokinase family)
VDTGPVIIRPGGRTGLSVILSRDSDRAILTFPGLIGALQETDVNDAFLSAGRHLHVASYFLQTGLQPNLESLFRRARTLGLTTSLDTNYDPSERWGDLAPVLSWTSVFMPNEREALALSGAADADAALRWLNSRVETVAIKLGSRGAIGGRNGMSVRAASISAHVVDTVGAGDAFDAGFLYGHLHGWDLAKSLQLACACGGLSTQRPGGVDGQPTIEEALQHVPG